MKSQLTHCLTYCHAAAAAAALSDCTHHTTQKPTVYQYSMNTWMNLWQQCSIGTMPACKPTNAAGPLQLSARLSDMICTQTYNFCGQLSAGHFIACHNRKIPGCWATVLHSSGSRSPLGAGGPTIRSHPWPSALNSNSAYTL